jgi:protein-S-isoprenylcysteine O-methyltransferase Ste14
VSWKQFTFEVSIQEDHKLVTTGPYAVVRHPSYSAALLVLTGVVCFHGSRGSWLRESGILDTNMGKILVYGITAILTIPVVMIKGRWEKEDEMLKKEFGKKWNDWAKRVPYAVLPSETSQKHVTIASHLGQARIPGD